MVKGWKYSKSYCDEPGTAGGVASGTNKSECEFMAYSFDIKFEGKNVCRLGNPSFQIKNIVGQLRAGLHRKLLPSSCFSRNQKDLFACSVMTLRNAESTLKDLHFLGFISPHTGYFLQGSHFERL
jgi:hypothetical protein